jgi:hypothetical protein
MAAEKEWSENPEDDPVELQKRQLNLAKKFLEKMDKAEAEEKRHREECQAGPPRLAGAIMAYKPPTFEEVSSVLQKAWAEVERIMPTAQDRTKAIAFQTLMQAAAPPPTFGGE